jgi:hypothetical protein
MRVFEMIEKNVCTAGGHCIGTAQFMHFTVIEVVPFSTLEVPEFIKQVLAHRSVVSAPGAPEVVGNGKQVVEQGLVAEGGAGGLGGRGRWCCCCSWDCIPIALDRWSFTDHKLGEVKIVDWEVDIAA